MSSTHESTWNLLEGVQTCEKGLYSLNRRDFLLSTTGLILTPTIVQGQDKLSALPYVSIIDETKARWALS